MGGILGKGKKGAPVAAEKYEAVYELPADAGPSILKKDFRRYGKDAKPGPPTTCSVQFIKPEDDTHTAGPATPPATP